MEVRTNCGYLITDSIHIGETEFVIGVHQLIPNHFVTWACKNGNDYFWGHYNLSSRDAAERDLVNRAAEEIRFRDCIRGDSPPQKQNKERER